MKMNIWSDCKKLPLTEVLSFIVDNRGKTVPTTTSGHILIATNCIKNDRLYPCYEKIRFLSEDTYQSFFRSHPIPGDILFVCKGTPGRCALVPDPIDFCIAQDMVGLRTNKSIIDNKYLLAVLRSYEIQKFIYNTSVGDVIPHFKKQFFNKLLIPVPPMELQTKIGAFYYSISQKIENNNKINGNLEAQAEALFKSWFVDFTPFKDQPFVDSELGPIPQGWKVGKYEDIILDTLAGDWGKEKITGNYTHEVACVRGCDFQDMNNGYRGNTPQRYILEKNYSAKRLLPQDLIIEISGGTLTVSTGRACLVSKEMLEKYDNNLVCTNFCKVIRPIDGYSAYCYYSWLHKYNNRVMFGYENGSSGLKNFRFKDFLTKEPLLIPPKADLIKFQHIIKLLQQKKQTNGTESTKLAALRDTLLPKLMSGEIKL